eukprot:maker-scaffold_42-snap-gene-0.51-mRNA-1 protein AED:0.00 eAED:0.00 QI:125/1/1/1/1/1/2/873/495
MESYRLIDQEQKTMRNRKLSYRVLTILTFTTGIFLFTFFGQGKDFELSDEQTNTDTTANIRSKSFDFALSKEKLDIGFSCLTQCGKIKTEFSSPEQFSSNIETDPEILLQHYNELLFSETLKPFRPNFRSENVLYHGYAGPKMEDHFFQHFMNLDETHIRTFFPFVPLYIHWTEVHFNKQERSWRFLRPALFSSLRKDVLYLTVSSDWSKKDIRLLKGFNIIFANSKGESVSHIILPHLFTYQLPAFNETTLEPLFLQKNTERVIENGLAELKSQNYQFEGYQKYQKMSYMTENDLVDKLEVDFMPKKYSFVGNLRTHKGRNLLNAFMKRRYKSEYYYGHFDAEDMCLDYSPQYFYDIKVEKTYSPCWRVAILYSNYTLCPVGTAPVSYRLYEAIQMGIVPIYLHGNKGAYVPYKGGDMDVYNLGYVTHFSDRTDFFKELEEVDPIIRLEKQKLVLKYRDSHYTPKGVMQQLDAWMKNPEGSDLQCCENPEMLKP